MLKVQVVDGVEGAVDEGADEGTPFEASLKWKKPQMLNFINLCKTPQLAISHNTIKRVSGLFVTLATLDVVGGNLIERTNLGTF